jgi:uncharacterized cupin superfamily protein
MERVAFDAVEPTAYETDVERRGLSNPLATENLSLNHYRLAPGERLAGLHAHPEQEEVFVVLDGEATFEVLGRRVGDAVAGERGTVAGDVREVTVAAGEAIRFAPGEFQAGRNAGETDLTVLGLGAPRDGADVRVPKVCPDCGRGDMRPVAGEDGDSLRCPDCETVLERPPPREEW